MKAISTCLLVLILSSLPASADTVISGEVLKEYKKAARLALIRADIITCTNADFTWDLLAHLAEADALTITEGKSLTAPQLIFSVTAGNVMAQLRLSLDARYTDVTNAVAENFFLQLINKGTLTEPRFVEEFVVNDFCKTK